MDKALDIIRGICNEWNALKAARTKRGGWLFDYKLYELSAACDDTNEFDDITRFIYDEWHEAARVAAGYDPETWDYNKYFEHDTHHRSYFKFSEDIGGSRSLDFWANDIGLEWDVTQGTAWQFTPFEKAIYETYNITRFSTDRLTPEEYTPEEIAEITDELISGVIPALLETLAERKAVIKVYDELKASQCNWIDKVIA